MIDPVRDVAIWEWSSKSEAFGNQAPNADPDGDGVAFDLALRFPGQQATTASGMFYNYQREYDPAVGRYSQSDPIGLTGGIVTYGYADAQPITHVDPAGLQAATVGQSARPIPLPGYAPPSGYQQFDPEHPGFYTGGDRGPYIYPDRIADQALAGLLTQASRMLPLLKPFWMQNQKDGSASKPNNCPTGTLPIDKAKKPFGLDHDAVETIKEGAGASPATWTGIAPNGDIWVGTNDGRGRQEGNIGDYGYGN